MSERLQRPEAEEDGGLAPAGAHPGYRIGANYALVPGGGAQHTAMGRMSVGRAHRAAAIAVGSLAAAVAGLVALARLGAPRSQGAVAGAAQAFVGWDRTLMPSATWTTFGADHACLLSDEDHTSDGVGTVKKVSDVPSIQACQDMCVLWPGVCKGIDFDHNENICALWTRRIGSTRGAQGRECMELKFGAIAMPTCYGPLQWGRTSKDQGEEISVMEYMNLNDCAVACSSMKDCHSFTACGEWGRCYMKSKTLADSDRASAVLGTTGGCQSFMAVTCAVPPTVSHEARKVAAVAPVPVDEGLEDAGTFAKRNDAGGVEAGVRSVHALSFDVAPLRGALDITGESMWRLWFHFDLPTLDEVEVKEFPHTMAAKEYALANNYKMFKWLSGKAHFLPSTTEVKLEHLVFKGEDFPVVLFIYGPMEPTYLEQFNDTDFAPPNMPSAAVVETLQSTDLDYLHKYAAQRGYVGFSVYGGQAFMKLAPSPLSKKDLTSADGVTLYVMRYAKFRPGNAYDYYQHDLQSASGGANSNQDCRGPKRCNDPDEFCFLKDASWAACHEECDVAKGWSCHVLGKVTTPGIGLFCFSIAAPEELDALKAQISNAQGIALCEDYIVFSSAAFELGKDAWTELLPGFAMGEAGPSPQTVWAAWRTVAERYYWRDNMWTVRVDPKATFFPNEFKVVMRRQAFGFELMEGGYGLYLRTCDLGLESSMTASVQALSWRAVMDLSVWGANCTVPTVATDEAWFPSCLQQLQVRPYKLPGVVIDQRCPGDGGIAATGASPPKCSFAKPIFYPTNTAEEWRNCVKSALQPR